MHASANAVLTPLNEMILTLCRLRLNLTVKYLAYRFYISSAKVSKAFQKWIDILSYRLKNDKRPEGDEHIETTLICFRRVFQT